MGVYAGPEITSDGLVLALDAGNSKGFDDDENLISHSASTSGIVLGVIGSGGSLPTGWGIDQGQPGTTLEVVGYGIEEGLNYIDLKFSGTTSTTNRWLVRPGNTVSLTSGVTYNSSLYAKTISGTPTDFRQFSVFGGGGGANLSGINSTLTRYSGSSAAGSTGTFFPRLDIGYNSVSTVMNFTIRVAGFQAEVGSSVSPYYPTTGTAKTRGSTLIDMTGRGNTGTLTNGPTYNSSNGGSIVFDGTNDYVTFSSTSLNLYPITLSFWATPSGDVINKYVASSVNGYRVSFGTGGISGYYFKSGSDYTLNYDNSYGSGTLGVFSCGTMTVDATGVKFYINGQLVGSNSWTGTAGPPTTAEAFKLGVYSSVYRTGNIAQASIYNRALTAAEIQQNFNATRGRFGI